MKVPSIEVLRKKTKKKYNDDSRYDTLLRKISIYITWAFLHTTITANQVTILSAIIGVIGSFFFLASDPIYWIIGFLFLQLFRLLDVVDGEVARSRGTESEFGEYLDTLLHPIIDFFIFSCIAFGLYFIYNNLFVLGLGLLVAFSKIGFSRIKIKKSSNESKKNDNIVVKVSSEIGSYFQFVIIPSILDLILNSSYFRLLFVIISGIFFPLIFIWRLYNFLKFRSKQK